MKAPATFPDEIRCQNCNAVAPYRQPDVARRHGWRIAWTPQQPSWCPQCYGGEKVSRPSLRPASYDEPLFEVDGEE